MRRAAAIGMLLGPCGTLWAGTLAPQATPGDPATPGSGSSAMTDIHDIKPILAMGLDLQWLYWLFGILLLAGLAFVVWRWLKRRSKKAPSLPPAPEVAADEQAYGALDRLAAEQGLAPRPFYFRLSAILRRYIERQYQFPAAEMTTEELLPRMEGLALDRSVVQQFKALCRTADPVKFAGADAGPEQLKRDLAFARQFVQHSMNAIPVSENPSLPALSNQPAAAVITGPGKKRDW